jgi:hypothetical protein
MVAKKASEDDPNYKVLQTNNDQVVFQSAYGVYTLKRPKGRIGAKHFRIMTRAAPKSLDENGRPSPADQDRALECQMEWIEEVLPEILISPASIDEIPGEDFLVAWVVMSNEIKLLPDTFRIL